MVCGEPPRECTYRRESSNSTFDRNRSQIRPKVVNQAKPTKPIFIVGLFALLLAAASCSSTPPPTNTRADAAIDIATFDFPESMVLGEIYAQALEEAGYEVHRHIPFGARELVMPALTQHFVDLVPEYIGTALQFASLGEVEPSADQRETRSLLKGVLESRGATLLASAPGENQNAFVVTEALAERFQLETLSDLTEVDGGLTLGGPPECPQRVYCLQGLESVYGMQFADFLATDSGGPVTLSTLIAGEIDVALLFTTDPAIERYDLVLLDDDRRLQPAENVTPVVRSELIEDHGSDLASTINSVTKKLSTTQLRSLNGLLNNDASNLHTVAADWLARVGRG
jgi:osmoprotectant transport system substrate-binding protein